MFLRYILNSILIIMLLASNAQAQFSLNKTGFVISTDVGEDSVTVTNTGKQSLLLYATEALEETKKISGHSVFYLSPPVSKLSPGQSQIIRIIIKDKKIKKELLARLLFQEVIPRKNFRNKAVITSAYNIAAVAHPEKLVENTTPWERLILSEENGQLFINNNSLYVVRLVPSITIHSKDRRQENKMLSHSYILPHSRVAIGNYNYRDIDSVGIRPVSQTAITLPEYQIRTNDN